MDNLKMKDLRKAGVALATFVATLLTLGVFPEDVKPYVLAGLSALGTYGVYAVRNGDKVVEPGHAQETI